MEHKYIRLDTFLAEAGIGTKKEVKQFIRDRRISVNGSIATDSFMQIQTMEMNKYEDQITMDGQLLSNKNKRYYMFNKPQGCLTARSDANQQTIFEYLKDLDCTGLFPVGRLDKDTEGLLFLTNDGAFNHRLMNPEYHVEKRYFFWAIGKMTPEKMRSLTEGILISNKEPITKPAKLEIEEACSYEELSRKDLFPQVSKKILNNCGDQVFSGYITITEGRKRQVRRMLRAVGCYIIYLRRDAIASISLDKRLEPGQARPLTDYEIKMLL